MPKKKTILSVATEAALRAGKLLLSRYGKLEASQVETKSKNDFVTELDRRSEKLVISAIKKYFPDHGIQAEESGVSAGTGTLWIIDPLDGTSNYIHNIPIFSVSIGIMENSQMKTGVIYDPIHRELFTAEKGKGAFLNGRRIRVTRVPQLKDALMATGFPFRARNRFKEYLASFQAISLATVGLRRGGSAALDLAYVACGRFDGFWEMDLSPWDIAAGALLIEEAGGKITDLWGKGDYLKNGDTLASNGLIHRGLQKITSKIFTPTQTDKRCRFI
jgi:myo-inositol-1(or 4)-monophosphatase